MFIEGRELSENITGVIRTKQSWKLTIITAALIAAVLLLVLLISIAINKPVSTFTRDPLQVLNAPFYTGLLSNAGILFWCAASALCLFTSRIITDPQRAQFLLLSGIFTSLLLLDDFFLFHEVVYRNYLFIPQKAVFTFYLLFLGTILFKFRKIILETDFLLLAAALASFFISGIVDMIPKTIIPAHHIFEDGSKFMGIVFWFMYYLRTCYSFIKSDRVLCSTL